MEVLFCRNGMESGIICYAMAALLNMIVVT